MISLTISITQHLPSEFHSPKQYLKALNSSVFKSMFKTHLFDLAHIIIIIITII